MALVLGGLLVSYPSAGRSQAAPFSQGERLVYAIKKMGVKAGEATLTYAGAQRLEDKNVELIVFTANAANFYDEEKIYVDPQTFRPVQVVRDLNIWGKKEKITEYYEAGKVRIVKNAGGKTEEQIIQKNDALDNLYGFIYRYRRDGRFQIGESLQMNLPTQDVTIKLANMDQIKAGGGTHTAYYMQSDPKKYKVWFDSSPQRIPLRIDGAVGFGNTSMVLRDYKQAG